VIDLSIEVDILLQGFPGRTNRGTLGFCNITLIKSDRLILYDTGHFSDRLNLINEFKKRTIPLEKVDTIVLSHLHYDHCLNIDLFKNAEIILDKKELEYALSNEPEKVGDYYIPKYLIPIIKERKFINAEEELEIANKVYVLKTPGHTPGSISLLIDNGKRKIAIVGDAIKNAWEFIKGKPEQVYGKIEDAKESIKKIKELNAIIIPGHDAHFIFEKNIVKYLKNVSLKLIVKTLPYSDDWSIYTIP
jgi:glyoxylase-like metal-dependent hydrolase (beta-lactamase superfamily II)